jgi:type II secretory pathway component GspD/PulD (secretin)
MLASKASKWMGVAAGVALAMGVQMGVAQAAHDAPVESTKGDGPRGCPQSDRNALPMKTFFLKNGGQATDGNEMLTGLRLILSPETKLYLVPSQNAIVIRGCAAELVTAQTLLDEIDRPRKKYKLNFTVAEMEGGKRVGVQHVSMFVEDGQRATLKSGSRVPIATGSTGQPPQTEFTYLDIGTNFDVMTTSAAGDGVTLKCKVEQSSLVEEKLIAGVQEPVIRQSVLENVSLLKEGTPQVLGAVDIAGSTRRLEIEVTAELVK